ncbi:MAG: porin [Betaproteobacteria bacterium]|nr:porin [Betaproteobacteria bacterium]
MKASKKINCKWTNFKQGAAALAVGMMTLSGVAYADDPIKRLLDLQLKKGIITQEEYDEFMSTTGAPAEPEKKAEPGNQVSPPDNATSKGPTSTSSEGGVAVIKTDNFKVEVFGTIDLSVGYTSHSLVQSGEMPTSIGPYISGGVRYPRTTPTGPGGAQVPYPASNMSSQTGIFNSALSTSSWGIRATRDIGADGLKAFVVLDSAINPATGQLTDQSHNESINSRYPTTAYATSSLNGQLFAKEAVGGFSGDKWGRITVGRNTNLINDVLNSYAPLQKAGLFSIYGNGVYGAGGGISENGRVDSSIKYQHKLGDVNLGLLYGFGSNGGLKKGNQGFAGNLGYETERFGVQLVYEEFKDVLKTATDATLSNVIDLTAYDQKALMLAAKYKLTDKLHTQVGIQQAQLKAPTPDPNIPFISNLYGENVAKSAAYVGETQKFNIGHLGFDYDFTEKLNANAAYMWVGLPRYNFGTPVGVFPSRYLGGYIDAWGGLLTYRLYKGTTLYTGAIFSHYRGDAFESNSTTIFVHDIFTASTGFRLRF